MSANNNTKMVSNEEEKFIDDVPNSNAVENLENGLIDKNDIRTTEVKSILKKPNNSNSDNKFR